MILAYSWVRPAILVTGKGREGMFLFCFFTFIPVPLYSLSLSSPLLSLFSHSLGDDTKWYTRVDVSLNTNTIKIRRGKAIQIVDSHELEFREWYASPTLSANYLIWKNKKKKSLFVLFNNHSYSLISILQWWCIYSNEINASAKVIEWKPISTLEKEQSKSCPFCMWHFYMTWYMSLPNIFKLSQTVRALWPAQYFGFREHKCIMKTELSLACDTPTGTYLYLYQILSKIFLESHSGEITRRPKQDLSFLHGWYMFLPIIWNSIACRRFWLQGT